MSSAIPAIAIASDPEDADDPLQAYGVGLGQDMADPVLRRVGIEQDRDAQALVSQIKHDPELAKIRLGQEQWNLIGSSGGATIAFDAAVLLQAYGIDVDNVVSLGGFAIRGRPHRRVRRRHTARFASGRRRWTGVQHGNRRAAAAAAGRGRGTPARRCA